MLSDNKVSGAISWLLTEFFSIRRQVLRRKLLKRQCWSSDETAAYRADLCSSSRCIRDKEAARVSDLE